MQFFMLPHGDAVRIAAVVIAPFIGSFLGVLIRRLPAARPIMLSRSACDRCDATLGPADLVPILSYAWLRGRCRHCGGSISGFYPAVELAALAIALGAALLSPTDAVLINCAFGWMLLALGWIDAETYLLPDILTLPLVAVGVAQGWFLHRELMMSVAGAIAGYLFIWLLERAYRRLRGRDGIGLGDAKLLAAAGAWLGWENLPLVVLAASICALIAAGAAHVFGRTMRSDSAIPFGPFLALAMWVVLLVNPIGQFY